MGLILLYGVQCHPAFQTRQTIHSDFLMLSLTVAKIWGHAASPITLYRRAWSLTPTANQGKGMVKFDLKFRWLEIHQVMDLCHTSRKLVETWQQGATKNEKWECCYNGTGKTGVAPGCANQPPATVEKGENWKSWTPGDEMRRKQGYDGQQKPKGREKKKGHVRSWWAEHSLSIKFSVGALVGGWVWEYMCCGRTRRFRAACTNRTEPRASSTNTHHRTAYLNPSYYRPHLILHTQQNLHIDYYLENMPS